MFFADDSYIFCKANKDSESDYILQLLNIFEAASGQHINERKSSIFFSKNSLEWLKADLCQHMRFQQATDHTTYLGLPNIIGRNKSALFGFLKERLQNHTQGWDKKVLTKGGKEILLKTVAQSLPNYTMGVFLLPLSLCQDLERIMWSFLVANKLEKR